MKYLQITLLLGVTLLFTGQSCEAPTPTDTIDPTESTEVFTDQDTAQETTTEKQIEQSTKNTDTKTSILGSSIACSYYIDGIQENWSCKDNQWCGTKSGECLDEPFCEKITDCKTGEICFNGFCGPDTSNTETSMKQACSYYINGAQENWECLDSQWCGT